MVYFGSTAAIVVSKDPRNTHCVICSGMALKSLALKTKPARQKEVLEEQASRQQPSCSYLTYKGSRGKMRSKQGWSSEHNKHHGNNWMYWGNEFKKMLGRLGVVLWDTNRLQYISSWGRGYQLHIQNPWCICKTLNCGYFPNH